MKKSTFFLLLMIATGAASFAQTITTQPISIKGIDGKTYWVYTALQVEKIAAQAKSDSSKITTVSLQSSEYNKRLTDLEKPSYIDTAIGKVNKTGDTLKANTWKVDDLTKKNAALQSQLNALTAPLTGTIPKLDGRLAPVEKDVLSLKNASPVDIKPLSEKVDGIDTRLKNAEDAVKKIPTKATTTLE